MEDNSNNSLPKNIKILFNKPLHSSNFALKSSNSRVMPANPLLQRKNIPINSPKFGSRTSYISNYLQERFTIDNNAHDDNLRTKLPEENSSNVIRDNSNSDNSQDVNIELYLNNPKMASELVYCKNKLTKEGKISLDNIVNLKKQSKTKSKRDHTVEPYYQLKDENDTTLIFESRFDNGNLLTAYRTDDCEYQLLLQKDTNSNGYHQWFFFRITNTRKNNKVKLSIINLIRKRSKYSKGIKIWTYSAKKSQNKDIGWHHTKSNITYTKNGLFYYSKGKRKYYSTLAFDYTFDYDNDQVYFANCIPYTYSDLMQDLARYQKAESSKYPFFHRKTLCKTLGGNDLDYITINSSKQGAIDTSNNSNNDVSENKEGKDAVVLIARQHPSESPGSWIMKGAIEFLLSKCEEAAFLREQLIFKIIPMMNPDGVIEGNTRTSFAGCDLNRRWKDPSELYHPEIFYTKEMIAKLSSQRSILCMVDLHGHFGAFNSFFYCNSPSQQDEGDEMELKAFPYITAMGSEMINYKQSTFKMENYKKSTCRIALHKQLDIRNIVTLETSNFGLTIGKYSNCYLDINTYKEIGRDVCLGILMHKYHSMCKLQSDIQVSLSDTVIAKARNTIDKAMKLLLIPQSKEQYQQGETIEKDNFNEDSDKDSESEPSDDNLSFEEVKKLITVNRKVKKKKIKRHLKPKLSPMAYRTTFKKIAISQTMKGDANSSMGNFLCFDKLPQLKKASVNILKPTETNPIKLEAKMKKTQEISSYSKRNATDEKYKAHRKILSIQTYDSSLGQKQLTIEERSGRIVPSSVSNINSTGAKSPNCNVKLIGMFKVDAGTQTEEIYFTIHWSYFIGTCTILSEKKTVEANYISNKSINLLGANESFKDFYLQKFVYFQKKKVSSLKEQQIKPNTDKVREQAINGRKKLEEFYSIHEGTFVVRKLAHSIENKNRNGSESSIKHLRHIRLQSKKMA